ncbi:MAG: DUF5615 family PIN-like protein [Opitutales bacterium]
MSLLFDQNLSWTLISPLSDIFPGSKHVRLEGLAEESGRAIWEYARSGASILSLKIAILWTW